MMRAPSFWRSKRTCTFLVEVKQERTSEALAISKAADFHQKKWHALTAMYEVKVDLLMVQDTSLKTVTAVGLLQEKGWCQEGFGTGSLAGH